MAEEQAEETFKVLDELGVKDRPVIHVLNKIDQVENPAILHKLRIKYSKTVAISALNREGFDELLHLMTTETQSLRKVVSLRVPQSHYALVSELMKRRKCAQV